MRVLDTLTGTIGAPRMLKRIDRDGRPIATLGRWHHGDAIFDLRAADTVQLIFNLSGGHHVELAVGPRLVQHKVTAGSLAVNAPGQPSSVRVVGAADILHLSISQSLIGSPGVSSARAEMAMAPLKAFFAQALVALSVRGNDDRSLGELVNSIAQRLACRDQPVPMPMRGGLSLASRQRVQALIERRLVTEPWSAPSLAELAEEARLSLHHFAHAFRQSEGESPHAQILRRRLDRALSLLLQEDVRISEIGDASGFASPAHFVSAFRQHMGVTPGAFRDAARA